MWIFPILVSLGDGEEGWMSGNSDYAQMYGRRANLFRVLSDPAAPRRTHVARATDEVVPITLNYLRAPEHVLGLRIPNGKLGPYRYWHGGGDAGGPRGGILRLLDRGQETGDKDVAAAAGLGAGACERDHPERAKGSASHPRTWVRSRAPRSSTLRPRSSTLSMLS